MCQRLRSVWTRCCRYWICYLRLQWRIATFLSIFMLFFFWIFLLSWICKTCAAQEGLCCSRTPNISFNYWTSQSHGRSVPQPHWNTRCSGAAFPLSFSTMLPFNKRDQRASERGKGLHGVASSRSISISSPSNANRDDYDERIRIWFSACKIFGQPSYAVKQFQSVEAEQ